MAPYIASWGIIGAGWISSMFVEDLALPRSDVTDVLHSVAAVGARDKDRAAAFIDKYLPKGATAQQLGLRPPPVAVGGYADLYAREDVDIVYIGTLHPTHYDDVKAALLAGKHVLVEKPATLNAAEWDELVALATEKSLFLMEAFWTAFQPAVAALRTKLHKDKVIGDIHAVSANFSVPNYNVLPDDHRIIGLAAAGGPLLDIGAYCMVPARLALTDNPANKGAAPNVTCVMSKTRMGTDLDTTIVLDYANLEARAVCNMSFNARMPREHTATISGTEGEVVIHDILCRITKFSVTKYTPGETPQMPGKWGEPQTFEYAFPGTGLYFEADAVARDIRDGRTQNELVSHKYTAETLEIFDESRRQGGYILPEGMEKVGRVSA
ncbi:hypothetical protein CcaverHIS002_0405380 [Cutaneotrichosporon cavernicola]|uniref:D-xylose 1-dehydrogenase (NADP(+), D-xylono-1,5-lactone-forming) n=1 Tax=Cutaneotrichosporon cavernicola TaxID=279322 RepID=A0AA48L4C1_9TREE|nr:uncharacterized protein CcaverHIS019_0405350 [Cutaneotrichosporon cavernicola]BEI83934.1 hypothetical protein CcaverHIS002_0405380 [Cutaneotrichosporon cavernicola]BEI91715.1 hypothetical protein CcaverHIS019_0405350 [Cutaneotrichosporon cavernicola]BEI99489.1 hypothetical protein CcaverHIS631_0405320 [Cutaneotrichosporon cavernicola]BEJ07267.1 hypothetical protein CcaverHIS641_0405360 [Cutaneotrichosporon cavernicola]